MIATYTKTVGYSEYRTIFADSADEMMEYVLPQIRPRSREFYSKEIRRDLLEQGTSLIDGHSIGNITRVALRHQWQLWPVEFSDRLSQELQASSFANAA